MIESLRKSYFIQENEKYIKIDEEGNTEMIDQHAIEPGFSYRKVHYRNNNEWGLPKKDKQVFRDATYQIDERELENLDPENGRIVLRRLYELYRKYPSSQRPAFFPKNQINVSKVKNVSSLPPFVTEVGIFPTSHYKSLFITQNFAENGFYEMIINDNGRFSTDCVDDVIPVYEKTLQPIWNISLEESWKIILLKFWAKYNRGYSQIKQASAFQFLQYFTNSNWKYYNLTLDGLNFITFNENKQSVGKYVVKTKNTQLVYNAGLIPNCAGYEVMGIKKRKGHENESKKDWVLLIRSTLINKWAGTLSILDKQIISMYDPHQYSMTLQRDFMINGEDFLNLFAAAYVGSRRENKNCFSEYKILRIEDNVKNATFLSFEIKKHGFFDFCLKQFSDHKIQAQTKKSRVRVAKQNAQKHNKESMMRYLKCKSALIKINDPPQSNTHQQTDYLPLKYQAYDLDYSHGYNRGDARFISIEPGRYLLRIKLQKTDNLTHLVVNYCSLQKTDMNEVELNDSQKSLSMRQALASTIEHSDRYQVKSSRYRDRGEQVTYAETFDEIGYGFVGIRSKKNSQYSILVEVNPTLLRKEGFGLKAPFKSIDQNFSIRVNPGESAAVVLKKKREDYKWPPESIQIFREKKNN